MSDKVIRRCFSGKAGVWLKKKKNAAASSCLTGTNDTMPMFGSASLVTDSDHTGAGNRLSSNMLVEWDELRGRPVYRMNFSEIKKIRQHTTDEAVEDAEVEVTTSSLVNRNFSWKERSKKRKAFGGDRRNRPLTNLINSGSLLRVEKNIVTEKGDGSADGPFERSDNGPHSSTTTNPSWISAVVESGNCSSSADASSSKMPNNSNTEFNQYTRSESLQHESEASQFEFQNSGTQELLLPCDWSLKHSYSTTQYSSLATAREFFEKLEEHRLTLDTSDTPKHVAKRPCCRTRRLRRLSSPTLTGEYGRYVEACQESDVLPLPKDEYVINRGEFFRTNELYDGFLDE